MSEEKKDLEAAPATAPTTETASKAEETATSLGRVITQDHAVQNGETGNGLAEKENILQHEKTISENDAPSETPAYLKQEHTLNESIDLENKQAFKGDDSDGKIEWTIRRVCEKHCLIVGED
jgi:hypothetical protein